MPVLDLQGQWTLTRLATGEAVPATVPGDNLSALLAAGRVPAPYVGCQELELQWLGREDFELRREFQVGPELLAEPSVCLDLESVDTVAEIRLNGKRVGRSDNMFQRQRYEVKRRLRPGTNELVVRFRGAETEALARAQKLPYPIPCGGAPVHSPHRNLLRKVQCHAGWDWGPCLMVCGLYGDVRLLAGAERIEHVCTTQVHRAGACRVEVEVEVEVAKAGARTFRVQLGDVVSEQEVELVRGTYQLQGSVEIAKPELWWPNGYGAQPLYPLEVRVGESVCRKQLGLRELELVTKPDKQGLGFKFRINGVDIFAKGANWIPVDAMPGRHTPDVYEDLLASAVAAHMNMLRVWGGGQYERECFYDLCDRKGLLVWQDFMFVRPAGRTHLRVQVPYTPDRGKC